jgi:hypothetical protein
MCPAQPAPSAGLGQRWSCGLQHGQDARANEHRNQLAGAAIARAQFRGGRLAIPAAEPVLEPRVQDYDDIVMLACETWNELID